MSTKAKAYDDVKTYGASAVAGEIPIANRLTRSFIVFQYD